MIQPFGQISALNGLKSLALPIEEFQSSWYLLLSAIRTSMSEGRDSTVAHMDFLLPQALWLAPLPLLMYLIFKHRLASASALVLPQGVRVATASHQGAQRTPFGWLLSAFIIWLLLLLAASRPTWIGPPLDSPISGRDLMLAIDTSGSMRESDLYSGNQAYTRISVVQQLASDFVQQRAGDRVGLIMFGSNAYVQTPLTFDHKTVAHFIREARVGLAGRSTAIGDAIGLGVKRLRDRPVDSRVMLLLTDGANSAGVVDPMDAARVAADNAIRIHTIGVGSDQNQQTILGFPSRVQASELDEKTLIQIAELTGGQYFRARNVRELQRIYQLIDELEPAETESDNFRVKHELFVWPLGISLLCSLMLAWLRQRRIG